MSILSWVPLIGDLVDTVKKVVPDRAAQDEIIGKINQTMADAAAKQADITMVEAGSADKFKSRWRPAIGWICAAGLALHFLFFPVVLAVMNVLHGKEVASTIDVASLLTLVLSLLGLGGLRTIEKVKGAD